MLPPEDRELLTQAMNGLNFDPASAHNLMAKFDYFAGSLEENRFLAVPPAAFGGSYTGGQRLATNTEMAREAAYTELKKMADALRTMGESVGEIGKDFERVDDQSAATSSLYKSGTDGVGIPTFGGGQRRHSTNSEG